MIKKTVYLGNPYHVCIRNRQLELRVPEGKGIDRILTKTVSLADLGILILDHPQITLTHPVLQMMSEFNIALVSCGENHMPSSLLLPLEGHSLHQERLRSQVEASEPLKKQLWQQTIKAKVRNQGMLLSVLGFSEEAWVLNQWANEVLSGDTKNIEARAAVLYWKTIFSKWENEFIRDRMGSPINSLLNYAYAILRATVARSLVGSGLLPSLGIHHRNKYNAYCLADDIMEPYRIYADRLVYQFLESVSEIPLELTKTEKGHLLTLPGIEVNLQGQRSPLMVAMTRTTNSLAECMEGRSRKVLYPELT